MILTIVTAWKKVPNLALKFFVVFRNNLEEGPSDPIL